MLTESIALTADSDFGYLVPDVDDPANAVLLEEAPAETLQPVKYFERTGRIDEYRRWGGGMKAARRELLQKFEVDPAPPSTRRSTTDPPTVATQRDRVAPGQRGLSIHLTVDPWRSRFLLWCAIGAGAV